MKNSNIIAAGKMIAIALMILGTIVCIATFTYFKADLSCLPGATLREALFSNLIAGLVLFFCGLVLFILFPRAERSPALADPLLALGIFVAIDGITAVVFMPHNAFTWIMALVAVPMFIDTLCLKINLSKRK